MKLPFTIEQFLEVFKNYNLHIFPLQFLFYLLSLLIIYFSLRKNKISDRLIVFVLSLLFIWSGLIYHIFHFSVINPAAYLFGAAFIIQGVLLFYFGFLKRRLEFNLKFNLYGIVGIVLVFYALVLYPLLGYLNGHVYPYSPTFGVPCPTLIF